MRPTAPRLRGRPWILQASRPEEGPALIVSVLIGTYGSPEWRDLARTRAYPSAVEQGALEVVARHEPSGTLAGVRNHLADLAEGDWLLFLDGDDELCPDYLREMALAIGLGRSGEVPLVLLAPAVLYCDGDRARGPARIPNLGKWPDTNECVIGTLVPRDLFLDVGGFRELPSLEDYDLWLRCCRAGATIVHVPEAIYIAYVNPSGGRNADQSVYWQLREEHADLFFR